MPFNINFRDTKVDRYPLPKLELNPDVKNIEDFTYADIKLVGYKAHPHIAGKVAV